MRLPRQEPNSARKSSNSAIGVTASNGHAPKSAPKIESYFCPAADVNSSRDITLEPQSLFITGYVTAAPRQLSGKLPGLAWGWRSLLAIRSISTGALTAATWAAGKQRRDLAPDDQNAITSIEAMAALAREGARGHTGHDGLPRTRDAPCLPRLGHAPRYRRYGWGIPAYTG